MNFDGNKSTLSVFLINVTYNIKHMPEYHILLSGHQKPCLTAILARVSRSCHKDGAGIGEG